MVVAVWRTRTGLIRSTGQTVSIDVEAWAAPSDVSVQRVSFTIQKDEGAPTATSTKTPTLRAPNYSDATSPIPNAGSAMAPALLYGFTLDVDFTSSCTITATVTTAAGTFTVPGGPIVVYNATSPGRPNTAVKYCDYDNGNDSTGDGSNGNPYKTVTKATDAVMATSVDRNGGGGRVIVKTCELLWAGPSISDWYTSGHWPFTIEFEDDVVIRTKDDGTESPILGAYGVDASRNRCYIRLIGSGSSSAAKVGSSYDIATPNKHPQIWSGYKPYTCEVWLWLDGLRAGSQHWTPGEVSIRFDEKTEPGGLWFAISGADVQWKKWGSCLQVEGASDHMVDFTDMHDCYCQDCSILFFGGSTQNTTVTNEMTYSGLNVIAHNMKIGNEEELGYVDVMASAAGDFVASTQSGGAHDGKLRIDCATDDTWGTQFADILVGKVSTFNNFEEVIGAQLQGANVWCCFIRNWATIEALGTTVLSPIYFGNTDPQDDLTGARFDILEVGTNGSGRPYIILDAAGTSSNSPAPYQNPISTWRQIRPRIFSGNRLLDWAPHGGTDHMFQAPNKLVDSIRSNFVLYDLDGCQGPFNEVVEMRKCAYVNYTHYSQQGSVNPGIYNCPWQHAGMLASQVLLINCSWGGAWNFTSSQTWTDCLIVNNAFHQMGTDGPQHGIGGTVVSHNHFQVGSTSGINATTGTWYLTEPQSASVHSFEPTLTAKGYSTYSQPSPTEYRWPSGYARGSLKNTSTQDWSLTPDLSVTGDLSRTISLSVASTAVTPFVGTASGTVGLSVTSVGTTSDVPVSGAAAGTISLSVAATGAWGIYGDATGGISLSVLSAGFTTETDVVGDATGSIGLVVGSFGFVGEMPVLTHGTILPHRVQSYMAQNVVDITPNDATEFEPTNGFRTGSAGYVAVRLRDHSVVTIFVAAPSYFPLRISGVDATGTTATGIAAVY